jgi:hypothetical protein
VSVLYPVGGKEVVGGEGERSDVTCDVRGLRVDGALARRRRLGR